MPIEDFLMGKMPYSYQIELVNISLFCQQTGFEGLVGPLLRSRSAKISENRDLDLKELSF